MTNKEAIEVIKSNYPNSNSFTELKEALDKVIDLLEKQSNNCLNCVHSFKMQPDGFSFIRYCGRYEKIVGDDDVLQCFS